MAESREFNTGEGTDSPSRQEAVNGEYRFSGDSIYSDAHFEPAGSSTEPPRYYTPPTRTPRERRKRKKNLWPSLVALALVCTLLGGLFGALVADRRTDRKLDELRETLSASYEERLSELEKETSRALAADAQPAVQTAALSAAEIFERAKEQVVGITTEVTYMNFFGMRTSSAVSGSGFILSKDGFILTNYHVIDTAAANGLAVTVMLHDGSEYTAAIVGCDADNDLAVLKIDAEGLRPASFGNSDALEMGETVYAVGNPLGELAYSMSTGTVSGLDRVITTEDSSAGINMFQIDAAVNHGNSGGPVYNTRGEVVGVVTAKSGASNAEGLGFAIPVNDAAPIAEDLMTKGYVSGKAFLGVTLYTAYSSRDSLYYGLPIGAYVSSVDSGGPAEIAGLQPGDIITALGDHEIGSYSDLRSALRAFSAGDSAEMTFYRAGDYYHTGEYRTVSVTFDEAGPGTSGEFYSGKTGLYAGAEI